ncbi:MAG: SDR family NAD(P)-dependent oxidoreductase [Acuticoccus sp.]
MNERPLAIVTGASSGIGAALAAEIARDGYALLLVARRADRLRALAERLDAPVEVFAADLTDPGAIEALAGVLAMQGRQPDVLVNNAGFGQGGAFAAASAARDLQMVDLNVRAVVDLTHRFLPGMLARGRGGVLNVASIVGYQAGPYSAVYSASKAFVLSFSDALYSECANTGVAVSALCPGPVETEFFSEAGAEKMRFRRFARALPAERVAAAGWRGFKAGKRRVVPGTLVKLRALTAWMTPAALELPVVKAMQRIPEE